MLSQNSENFTTVKIEEMTSGFNLLMLYLLTVLLGQTGADWGNLDRGVYVRNCTALVLLINYASFRND